MSRIPALHNEAPPISLDALLHNLADVASVALHLHSVTTIMSYIINKND